MLRILSILPFLFVTPALAQGLSAEAYAKQTQAIATRVQQQLMACWSVPAGEEGQRLGLDIVFFGDGRLDGEAALSPQTEKRASKREALRESVLRAVRSCVPFEGLEALGAGADERFSVTIIFQS